MSKLGWACKKRKNDEKQPKKFQKHVESPTVLTHRYGSMYLLICQYMDHIILGQQFIESFVQGIVKRINGKEIYQKEKTNMGMSQNKRDKLIWMQTKE